VIAASVALGEHDGSLREILHALKYGRRTSIASTLATALREPARHVLDGAHAAVPVPLHPLRAWWRGFNQARLIAQGLGLPVVDALVRRRATLRQSALARDDRWTNLQAVIDMRRGAAARLRATTVVLVDDVVTTGATVTACARVLRAHGVAEVRVVSAARAVRRSPR
jgi:ComF family protein